ncbi:MAG: hypothetical protein WDM78_11595 [Puia sp.]
MDKLKFHFLHLFFLNLQLNSISVVIAGVGKSNLAENDLFIVVQTNNLLGELAILKYHNFHKDWTEAKKLVHDQNLIESIEKAFGKITSLWPDIDKYRNEVISHPFARPFQGTINKRQSIFSISSNPDYLIPFDKEAVLQLIEYVGDIAHIIWKFYPGWFNEFVDGTFPPK